MATIEDTKDNSITTPARNGGAHHPAARILILLILIVIALAVWFFFFNKPKMISNTIEVSGRIEGYEVNVGAKIGGRVNLIAHREGEAVNKGELLAQLSDEDIQAQLRGAQARILMAKERTRSADDKIELVQSQIGESELKITQSKEDSVGRISQMESMVAMNNARLTQARSELLQAKADAHLAQIRKDRYEFLVSKEAVTKDEADQVATASETARALVSAKEANVVAAQREMRAAEGQLGQARSSRLSPRIESAQKNSLEKQLAQAEHEKNQSEHDVQNTEAERDQTLANIAYLKILSPISGVVTARTVEPGAVVVPGQTLMSLLDLSKVYLRAYVAEGDIGRVRIGQKAQVFLDAKPTKPFEGRISQIDPQGSFTPENIYFKNDRIKQVFGVKIEIKEPGGFAKPGMPADAKIMME